ncbi:hypothetical protein HYH02_004423 [Chlamydomonas schloesseri]|uniref:Uncharacterized protein n=1 Tax=Chlamydomonas schloesseri TaxID=2026947 RepID=A0A835WPL5_9CHLO|nr:hypothetical protein HYH02_004423 [Chlamydomonas schloesseri]|eukprot:KAG2451157.1 hypothetical protein HYH02_004423 [Chlamydomonas schloesseri]
MADPNALIFQQQLAGDQQKQIQQQIPQQQQQQQQPGQPLPVVFEVDPAILQGNLTRGATDAQALLPAKNSKSSNDFSDAVEVITPFLQLATSIAGLVRALGQQIPGLAPLVAETDQLERYAKAVYAATLAGCKVQQHHLAVFCRYAERQLHKVHEPAEGDNKLQVLNDKEFKQSHIDVKDAYGSSPLAKPGPTDSYSRKRAHPSGSYQQPHYSYQPRQPPPGQPYMGPIAPARQGPARGPAPPPLHGPHNYY